MAVGWKPAKLVLNEHAHSHPSFLFLSEPKFHDNNTTTFKYSSFNCLCTGIKRAKLQTSSEHSIQHLVHDLPNKMPRFHGYVKTFFTDRNIGYITELGETGSLSKDNLVDRDVFFKAIDLKVSNPTSMIRKTCTGHIVEYERQTDERGRHRAFQITNLYETPLPCESGLVIFKRYIDLHRETLRQEGHRAVQNYTRGRSRGGGGGS